VCVRHGGRVVKTLGDGVMVVFAEVSGAVDAVVHLQREHALRRVPAAGQALQLQVGLDRGELVEVGGDCFGDAVNVAARLSGLSGAREIWATDTVIAQLARPPAGARFHCLGEVPIRGKTQQRQVYRIEWQEAVAPRA
jgi:class 3 adenylate cyclase